MNVTYVTLLVKWKKCPGYDIRILGFGNDTFQPVFRMQNHISVRELLWSDLKREDFADYSTAGSPISELKMYAFELITLFPFYPHVEFTHETWGDLLCVCPLHAAVTICPGYGPTNPPPVYSAVHPVSDGFGYRRAGPISLSVLFFPAALFEFPAILFRHIFSPLAARAPPLSMFLIMQR